jgi:hypothetical protein
VGRLGSCVCVTLFTTGVTLLYYCCYYCCYYCTTVARVCVPHYCCYYLYYCTAVARVCVPLLQLCCSSTLCCSSVAAFLLLYDCGSCMCTTLARVSLLLCLWFSSQQLAATELQQSCNRVYYVYSGSCLLTYSCVSSKATGLLDLKSYVSSYEVLNLLAFLAQKYKS